MSIDIKYKELLFLTHSKWVKTSVYMLLISFFYNLPVMNYSVTGDNELRLFDFAGLLIIYVFLKHNNEIMYLINREKTLKSMYQLLLWSSVMWFSTLVFCIAMGRPLKALQSLLYLYHFWTFFLGGVFLVIMIQDLKQLKTFVNTTLILGILAFLIVFLQNLGLVPFLWSDEYKKAYSFLSGTLGPNKIVLGMTSLLTFAMAVGILNDKKVKINKILTIVAILFSLLALVISGSRTSYVGLSVFLFVFMLFQTKKFIYSVIVFTFITLALIPLNIGVFDMAVDVYEKRVTGKIKNPNDLKEANVDELYEDLGSGRKGLSVMYIEYLIDNPVYVVFGSGFNNRLLIGSPAHNLYLSLLYEMGILGFVLYFRWLFSYMFVPLVEFKSLRTALWGLVLAMAVTLFFGEHLYIYRPLFGLLGLFLFVSIVLMSPHYIIKKDQ